MPASDGLAAPIPNDAGGRPRLFSGRACTARVIIRCYTLAGAGGSGSRPEARRRASPGPDGVALAAGVDGTWRWRAGVISCVRHAVVCADSAATVNEGHQWGTHAWCPVLHACCLVRVLGQKPAVFCVSLLVANKTRLGDSRPRASTHLRGVSLNKGNDFRSVPTWSRCAAARMGHGFGGRGGGPPKLSFFIWYFGAAQSRDDSVKLSSLSMITSFTSFWSSFRLLSSTCNIDVTAERGFMYEKHGWLVGIGLYAPAREAQIWSLQRLSSSVHL